MAIYINNLNHRVRQTKLKEKKSRSGYVINVGRGEHKTRRVKNDLITIKNNEGCEKKSGDKRKIFNMLGF